MVGMSEQLFHEVDCYCSGHDNHGTDRYHLERLAMRSLVVFLAIAWAWMPRS